MAPTRSSSSPSPRLVVFVGDRRDTRIAAVRRHLAAASLQAVADRATASWPFRRSVTPAAPPRSPRGGPPGRLNQAFWLRDLHLAFPSGQTPGTRLVLTQSAYQMQRWLDWLEANTDALVVGDAEASALHRASPEALTGRGPWSRIEIARPDEPDGPEEDGTDVPDGEVPRTGAQRDGRLHAAFMQPDPERRLDVCRGAARESPDDPAILLALASVCMEVQRLAEAREVLDRAVALAPDWEATHFERGKLLLRAEETEAAADAFAAAARLMPRFAAAWSNLGAALGELGRSGEALDALQRAREADPRSHLVVNNLGAVYREQGRLDEAAARFREVIALAPSFVFGYYNLAHTLFLGGQFEEARRMYEEAFARDPRKNERQACRLAMARLAARDTEGAVALLEALVEGLPADRTRDLFEEAESTLDALSAVAAVDPAALARVRPILRRYSS